MKHPLANSIPFDPSDPPGSLAGLPEAPGVFALYAADSSAEPYMSKTPNLRRRLMRFLRSGQPPEASRAGVTEEAALPRKTRRLQLAHMVHRIEYSVTGSEFESSLCLYQASLGAFGDRARKRLRLRPPTFLRMSLDNPYPRVYPTSRISKSAAHALFGPFPSRAAAERYGEEMLNLFLLRRCTDDLHPDPAFPGCPYSEMKMCLAPCFKGCSDERYKQESDEVLAFLSTRGSSLQAKLEAERSAASELLEFERAASIHQRMQKAQAVAHLAGEAVRPLSGLSGIVIQPAAVPGEVALFRLRGGWLSGPAFYSTIGMRLANERSGSTSLFPQPISLEPVPLGPAPLEDSGAAAGGAHDLPSNRLQKDALEVRLDDSLSALDRATAASPGRSPVRSASSQVLSDHLALFTRWFYRPTGRRTGEVLFAGSDGEVARKALLRAISRVAARAASTDPAQIDRPPVKWHA